MEGDDKAEEVESETVVEDEDDAEIRELEAKLAAAKAKKEDSAQHAEKTLLSQGESGDRFPLVGSTGRFCCLEYRWRKARCTAAPPTDVARSSAHGRKPDRTDRRGPQEAHG